MSEGEKLIPINIEDKMKCSLHRLFDVYNMSAERTAQR